MKQQDLCKCCGSTFIKHRNPNQLYCTSPICQRERKNTWRRSKMKNDSDYNNNQKSANKRWQAKNQDYWKNYRQAHPDYVERNRNAQRVRDGTGSMDASHLAKSDASPNDTLIGSGSYWLFHDLGHLAKSDALKVKITVITS